MSSSAILQINMLGEFSLTYGDSTINDQNSRSRKLWTLLEYLITFRDKEITQNELIELLWPDDSCDDPANTLKTLLHRVRAVLGELNLEDPKKMIAYHRGTYSWIPGIPCTIDVEEFEQFCKQAAACAENEEARLDLLLRAVALYKGDFLPRAALEFWVVPINTYYHTQYLKIVHEALDLLADRGRFDEIIEICQRAVAIDPYDEGLHLSMIRALVATGAQRAALQHYDYVTDLFFTQFGVTPSPELTALYKEIVKTSKNLELDLNIVKEGLREEEARQTAFFCEYEFFKDIYRLEARAAARTGQVIHIALITVTSGTGEPLTQKLLNTTMGRLKEVIASSLRRSDVFTRYSVAQYLIMLPSASFENGNIVMRRITSKFRSLYPKMNVTLHYKLLPLDPLPLS
jgi:DNA-binding SARP family transcriptional activator